MGLYSRCKMCALPINVYLEAGSVKIGPCCMRPSALEMFFKDQGEVDKWFKKFRPGMEPKKMTGDLASGS